jgi:hypothetical protein
MRYIMILIKFYAKEFPKKSQSNCKVLGNFGWSKLNHIFISFESYYFSSTFFSFFTSAYFWSLSLLLLIHGFYYYLTNCAKLNYQFNIIKWILCTKLFFFKKWITQPCIYHVGLLFINCFVLEEFNAYLVLVNL